MIRNSRRITSPVAWTVKRKNPRGDALKKKKIRAPSTVSVHRNSSSQNHFCPQIRATRTTIPAHRFVLPEPFLPKDSCHQSHFCPQIRATRIISAHRFVSPEPFLPTDSCHQNHFCPQISANTTTSAHRFVPPETFLPIDSCHQNHFCPQIRATKTISATNDLVPINLQWSIICVESSVGTVLVNI